LARCTCKWTTHRTHCVTRLKGKMKKINTKSNRFVFFDFRCTSFFFRSTTELTLLITARSGADLCSVRRGKVYELVTTTDTRVGGEIMADRVIARWIHSSPKCRGANRHTKVRVRRRRWPQVVAGTRTNTSRPALVVIGRRSRTGCFTLCKTVARRCTSVQPRRREY
jgi:hypothetical protein